MNTSRRMILSPGQQIGGFRIVAPIAAGGMAVVYEAEQIRLKRRVALKVLNERLARDDSYRERFIREGRHVASLEHPHIVPIYDADEEDGRLFIAMRFIDGETLGDVLADRRMPAAEINRVLKPIAAALDSAHEQRIVHRDIKPGNILIDRSGIAFLADFGIARAATATHTLTTAGSFVGSVHYASPEQARGQTLTGASDVYSLAVVYYQCITGEVPFRSDTESNVLDAHLTSPVPPVPEDKGGSHELNAVLQKALAKEPQYRFEQASELALAVEALLDTSGGEAVSSPPSTTTVHPLTPSTSVPTPPTAVPTPVAAPTPIAPYTDPNHTVVVESTTVDPLGHQVESGKPDEPRRPRLRKSTKILLGVGALAVAMPLAALAAAGGSGGKLIGSNEISVTPVDSMQRVSSTTASAYGLDESTAVAFANDSGQVVIGRYEESPAVEGDLPGALKEQVDGNLESQAVLANGVPARRFSANLKDEHLARLQALSFLGDDGRQRLVACMHPAGPSEKCEEVINSVNTANLKSPRPIAPTAAGKQAVTKISSELADAVKQNPLSSSSPSKRAENATQLAAAYSRAGTSAREVKNLSPAERLAFRRLANDARSTATSLKRIASAARNKNYAGYAKAVKTFNSAQRQVREDLVSLKKLEQQ